MSTVTRPPGSTAPPEDSNVFNNSALPPGFTLPPGVTIPPGFTIPPGGTIPPGLLENLTNGDLFGDDPNSETDAGFGDISMNDINVNATPVFADAYYRPYERVPGTNNMAGIPRFGHPSDFSYTAYLGSEANHADGEDYMVGLLFTGIFLLVFFVIWSIVLLIFKTSLTGFLCGDPFINPHLNDPASLKEKEEMEADGEEYIEDKEWMKRPRRIRIVFFISGLLQIIFAMLLVTHGVDNLQQTTDTVQISNHEVRLLVAEAADVASSLEQIKNTGLVLRDQIVFDLDKENFCPANPIFSETEGGQGFLEAAEGAIQMLKQLGDFLGEDVANFEEGLDETLANLDGIDVTVANVEDNEWIGGLLAFPYLILASLMMVGAIGAQLDAMTECYLCVLNWVVLPIYTLLTVFTYVILGLISIAASMNADFCGGQTGKPDQVLVDYLVRSGSDENDLFYQSVRYYANQCTEVAGTDPFLFLRNFEGSIEKGRLLVQDLTQSMDDISLEQLSLGCNRDFRPLHRSLGQMIGVLDALLQAANRALNLLRCETIVPIYTNVVYDGTCKYSITGLSWIFSCLLIMSVMGMIMIMFRSSYQNTIFNKVPDSLMDDSFVPDTKYRVTKKKPKRDQRGDNWDDE